jgi:hypothetical protein
MLGSKVTRLYSPKNKVNEKDMSWYLCDKKNLSWFVGGYNFYPTRQGSGIEKNTTRWIKIYIQPQTVGDPIFI